jgi:Domain of unknown function (DUF4845)
MKKEQGITNLGILLTVLILGSAVWLGFQVIPIYYSYMEVQSQFESMAEKAQVHDDKHIRRYLVEEIIDKLNLPVEEKDLKITRNGRKIIIDLDYYEYLTLDLGEGRSYDLHEFHFNPHAEADY